MSRIWKMPVVLLTGVEAKITENTIEIKGSKGTLNFTFQPIIEVKLDKDTIVCTPKDIDNSSSRAFWGTTRSIINNMVIGVSTGYQKSLEITGVGYKYEVQWKKIVLNIGFSHSVDLEIPAWIEAKIDEKKKNIMHISGSDKQLVGEFASKIRSLKKPEPYKGKGIAYVGEQIKRKAWKTWAK